MTRPTEHPCRALPAAGASDRGASSPSSGRAYRNHSEEIADARARLDALFQQSRERYASLSPEEKAAHDKAQRESWVRGMTARCDHGVVDFEQCSQCRSNAAHVPDRYRRAEGQIGPLWEPVNRRNWPSGWWVAPFIVFGAAGWAVALWAVL